jgi:hypothetical protein
MFAGYEAPAPSTAKQTNKPNSKPVQNDKSGKSAEIPTTAPETAVGKKRVAHVGTTHQMHNRALEVPKHTKSKLPTPAETVARRYEALRAGNSNASHASGKPPPTSSTSNGASSSQGMSSALGKRKRISHVPNVAGLMKPKAPSQSASKSTIPSSKSRPEASTLAHTIGKGERRVAHVPRVSGYYISRWALELGTF